MPYHIPLDMFETALLIEGYVRYTNHKISWKDVVADISTNLRQRAIRSGSKIDESFRSEKGISSQLWKIKQLMDGDYHDDFSVSHLYREMVELYSSNREKFEGILQEAKRGISEMKSISSNTPNHATTFESLGTEGIEGSVFRGGVNITDFRKGFENYLRDKLADKTVSSYLTSLSYVEWYVIDRRYSEISIFEIEDADEVRFIWNHHLSTDQTFVDYNRKKHFVYSSAMKQYVAYREEVENGESLSHIQEIEPMDQPLLSAELDYNDILSKTAVSNTIRKLFPNGFKFDDFSFNLLEKDLGKNVESHIKKAIIREMFKREDDVYFFLDTVIDPDIQVELLDLVEKYLKLNFGFEEGFLYELYHNHLNSSCIRNVGDFEDWILRVSPFPLTFSTFRDFRIARSKTFHSEEVYLYFLTQKIHAKVYASDSQTIEESAILSDFAGFSLDFLCKIVKLKNIDVFVKEVNGIICFQTCEGLGIPEDFSIRISSALDRIEELDLSPSMDVLNAFLAIDLGNNPRYEYGIDSDVDFKKLIQVCYKGDVPRKWKANVFGKGED